MSDYNFSTRRGEIIEVRELSDTHVSGNSLSTTHFNRCRIRWDAGQEEFVDCRGSYSIGDKVAVIFEKGAQVSDLNLNTGRYNQIVPKIGVISAVVFAMSCMLIFVGGIGLLTTPAWAWWRWNQGKKYKAALGAYVATIK